MPVPQEYDHLWSADRAAQNVAYTRMMTETGEPVEWAYDVWDDLIEHLSSRDNHDRSIASQLLARLAKSDPDRRIIDDFPALLAVTRDERFVTARHCLQALWEIGLEGEAQCALILEGFRLRFNECVAEKNCTLIRYDIIVGLKKLFNATGEATVRETAQSLISAETDEKYRKKYLAALK